MLRYITTTKEHKAPVVVNPLCCEYCGKKHPNTGSLSVHLKFKHVCIYIYNVDIYIHIII